MTDKIKLGLLDLLTVLLPGGLILAILLQNDALLRFYRDFFRLSSQEEWLKGAILIASAYILGHFVFIFASYLDDWIFENVRRVFWSDQRLTAYAIELKTALTGIKDRKVVGAFKWACAWLQMNQPTLYEEVERYIAESKFFRSLVITGFVGMIILLVTCNWPGLIAALAGTILCIIRYLTQRQKSIETAYTFVITAIGKPLPREPSDDLLWELSSRKVRLPEPKKDKPAINKYETRRIVRAGKSLKTHFRKVAEAIRLCAWPFGRDEIKPVGQPILKTNEIRWFSDKPFQTASEWLKSKAGEYENVSRSDIYYIKPNMIHIGIKDRGQEQHFEIKLQNVEARSGAGPEDKSWRLESWRKWTVDKKDITSFQSMLDAGKYKSIPVTKQRVAVKVTMDRNSQLEYHGVDEELKDGCMIEHSTVRIGYSTFYTFAVECFGNFEHILSAIESETSLFKDPLLKEQIPQSYPAFLHNK